MLHVSFFIVFLLKKNILSQAPDVSFCTFVDGILAQDNPSLVSLGSFMVFYSQTGKLITVSEPLNAIVL